MTTTDVEQLLRVIAERIEFKNGIDTDARERILLRIARQATGDESIGKGGPITGTIRGRITADGFVGVITDDRGHDWYHGPMGRR